MVEVEVAMICYKFIRTPTSRGHVEFPTCLVFFVLPPTTSITHRPTGSGCLHLPNGLDALSSIAAGPVTDTEPYVPLKPRGCTYRHPTTSASTLH